MENLKVGSIFIQAWVGVVNPIRFEVLELDREKDYLRVKCIGHNGSWHEEEWQGALDGLKFTEICIEQGEYKLIKE